MTMPASNYIYHPWGALPVPQTCFQIYGTKRKAVHVRAENSNSNEQFSSALKRRCLQPSTHQRQGAGQPSSPHQLLANQSNAPPSQSDCVVENQIPGEFQASFHSHNSMQLEVKDNVQLLRTPPTPPAFYSTAIHSHNPLHMDTATTSGLNNNNQETTDQSGDWPSAGNTQRLLERRNQNRLDMVEEVDFESNDYWDVPNDHYLLKMADEVEQARIVMETDFAADQHKYGCSLSSESAIIHGLDMHSTGGHVRCYCKPSWEGLLDPVSYL